MQQYKKLAKKTAHVPFNISDVTDAETVDYNNDANKNDVSSKKSSQKLPKILLTNIRIQQEKEKDHYKMILHI